MKLSCKFLMCKINNSSVLSTSIALHRAIETSYRPSSLILQQDFLPFDATLFAGPMPHRVQRIGPFEYVFQVDPVSRSINESIANLLSEAGSDILIMLEGSQSPLSLKVPHKESDADILVVINSSDQISKAKKVLENVHTLQEKIDVVVAPGIVHQSWLQLPYFYSALSVHPDSPDRYWWSASSSECLTEAQLRIEAGLRLIKDKRKLLTIRDETFELLNELLGPRHIKEWRIVPRWLGIEALI